MCRQRAVRGPQLFSRRPFWSPKERRGDQKGPSNLPPERSPKRRPIPQPKNPMINNKLKHQTLKLAVRKRRPLKSEDHHHHGKICGRRGGGQAGGTPRHGRGRPRGVRVAHAAQRVPRGAGGLGPRPRGPARPPRGVGLRGLHAGRHECGQDGGFPPQGRLRRRRHDDAVVDRRAVGRAARVFFFIRISSNHTP